MARRATNEQTTSAVLDAALHVFAQGGSSSLSIKNIGQQAGVSVGSLYHHFGSREGILIALYRRWMLELLGSLGAAVGNTETPLDMVSTMVGTYLTWVEAHEHQARFLLCAAPAEFNLADLASFADEKLAAVAPLFARVASHVAAGTIRPLPPQYYELLVIGPVAETARRWLAGEPIDLAQAREVISEAAGRALLTAPPKTQRGSKEC